MTGFLSLILALVSFFAWTDTWVLFARLMGWDGMWDGIMHVNGKGWLMVCGFFFGFRNIYKNRFRRSVHCYVKKTVALTLRYSAAVPIDAATIHQTSARTFRKYLWHDIDPFFLNLFDARVVGQCFECVLDF